MSVAPEPLMGLFPPAMHALICRHTQIEHESRPSQPDEDTQEFIPLSFESLWRFAAKRERGGISIHNTLRIVATRPHPMMNRWRWLHTWRMETDFWCSNKTPKCLILDAQLPHFALKLNDYAREWGLPEKMWQRSQYGYGPVCDIEAMHFLHFREDESAHERFERYIAGRTLLDHFRELGFGVDKHLESLSWSQGAH